MFVPHWQNNGYMDQVVAQLTTWVENQKIAGSQTEVIRFENRTPLIFIEISGQSDGTILLHERLDKQPEMAGCREGLDPWPPVLDGDKLYDRGFYVDTFEISCLIQNIPEKRVKQAKNASSMTGNDIPNRFPFNGHTQAVSKGPAELILKRGW